jgi:HlyD family secretion protein
MKGGCARETGFIHDAVAFDHGHPVQKSGRTGELHQDFRPGVEEQRANVLINFAEPRASLSRLGDAYRVEARIVIRDASDVLKVSPGALFRRWEEWAVFRLVNGKPRLSSVRAEHSNGLETEVLEGLDENGLAIVHSSDWI